ncbi:MAG: MFS transporter [Clostridia bacterium]|nr:MFS transporter [Clostridia bacterium]
MGVKSALNSLKSTYLDNESISNKEQLGFAGGIFGNAMGQDSVDTFADKFDRNFMGISNGMMTIKGNISTVLSFFIPPVAGALYDMPSRRTGKSNLRKALLFAPIPFAITSMLLFVVPTQNAMYNFIWTLFLSVIFSIADTFYDIALNALALKMVSNPADRKKFFTFESIASTLGSMAPGSVIPIIVGMTDDAHKQQWLYFFIALGFCIIGVLAMYAPYMTIQERSMMAAAEYEESKKKENGEKEKIKLDKRTVKAILHNRPFIIIQLATICETIRQITYKILPYLYDDTFNDFKMKTIVDAISGTFSYVGLMAVPFVGKKFSAKAMLIGGYSYTAIFYTIISLFNINFRLENVRKKRYLIGLCIGLSGIPNAMQAAAKRILVADSTDYMEWYGEKTFGMAVRSDGLLSAAQNIVAKFNALLKTNIYNIMFSLIGYKSNDLANGIKPVQTNNTLRGIYRIASICGLLGNLLPAICFLFDNYSGERKDRIYNELCEMRAKREELLDNELFSE